MSAIRIGIIGGGYAGLTAAYELQKQGYAVTVLEKYGAWGGQAATLLGYLVLIVMIYVLVFTNQKPVLDFLGGPLHENFKIAAAVAVAVFSPLIAYVYGTVSELTLKIINVD